MRTKRREQNGLAVATYDELRRFCDAFSREKYDLMTLVGPGGTGKSETVTREMNRMHTGSGWSLIKGKQTPLALYHKLYESRLQPIVLDDIDSLLSSPDNTAILKCVCETKPVKQVEWGSFHRAFRDNDLALPPSFESISRVCVIANDLGRINENIQALLTRGLCLNFRPNAMEVHREVARGGWFDDDEVFDFVGQHLWLHTTPNLRNYLIAKAHKLADLDWRELTLRGLRDAGDRKLVLLAELLADPSFDAANSPEDERAVAFAARGGGSRATYFRQKARLLNVRGAIDAEIAKSMRLGPVIRDANWYSTRQREEYLLSLRNQQRTNGNEDHFETQLPEKTSAHAASPDLEDLKTQLQSAIEIEDYERAAQLRDEIDRHEAL